MLIASSLPDSAFCVIHCDALQEIGFKIVGLREFLIHCGANPGMRGWLAGTYFYT